MSDWLDEPRWNFVWVTIPVIRMAFALSVLLHVAVLWGWLPRMHDLSFEFSERDKASGPLVVQLAPQPSRAIDPPAAPPSASALETPPTRRAPPSKAAPRRPPTPPVIAQDQPAPAIASPPVTPAVAAPALTPVEGDFSSYLEARRRARGASPQDGTVNTPPAEDERERHNRVVAANLGLDRTPTFGTNRTGGGVFRIQHLSSDSAEFIFFGWNKDIRRNSQQVIEVRKGDNSDIRIAVVRRMIGIIRDRESGDFDWLSPRLGGTVTLSARPRDNAGLEDFMMQEFFGDSRSR
jgi:hypothetical protein